jgi:uncharacterized LabA/DUF88 family protein
MRTLQQKNRRALHIIDIENLLQSSILSESEVQRFRDEYFHATQPGEDDLFVIGVSHFNQVAAIFGWGCGKASFKIRSGENGADLALIEEINSLPIKERFDEVVIVSGDGIFSDIAKSIKCTGVETSFIGRANSTSRTIRESGLPLISLPSLRASQEEYCLAS